MKILVIGASGMLGSTMLRVLSEQNDWDVHGTVRDGSVRRFFSAAVRNRLVAGVDVERTDNLIAVLEQTRPDVIVNCAGVIKQKAHDGNLLNTISVNALVPHRLAQLCGLIGARLIHVSTDCVFSGDRGGYVENDIVDARDTYGRSKVLGEVHYPHTVSLRTSIIGHELRGQSGLLEWFLSQQGRCTGYTHAVFSGMPTVTFSALVRDVVIPHADLTGVYHVAATPIAKAELLRMIASVYGKTIEIVPDPTLIIDRSLDATRLRDATGYVAPGWSEMLNSMHAYK